MMDVKKEKSLQKGMRKLWLKGRGERNEERIERQHLSQGKRIALTPIPGGPHQQSNRNPITPISYAYPPTIDNVRESIDNEKNSIDKQFEKAQMNPFLTTNTDISRIYHTGQSQHNKVKFNAH